MNISKEAVKKLIENAFRCGMLYGYGVNHENIEEDENKAWEEFIIGKKLYQNFII